MGNIEFAVVIILNGFFVFLGLLFFFDVIMKFIFPELHQYSIVKYIAKKI